MRAAAPLVLILLASAVRADAPDAVRSAVDKGLRRIEQGAARYPSQRTCFSCHHQALPILSLTSAQRRGFRIDERVLKASVEFSLKSFRKKEALIKGQGVGGANTTVAYALTALAAADHAPDATTAALVQFLLVRQRPDGSWPAVTRRPPSEGSAFTNAALALSCLTRYGLDKKLPNELPARVTAAIDKSRAWLLKNQPQSTEDKIFRLRGLIHAGVADKHVADARTLLVHEQQPDGSWGQRVGDKGDAYATGAALVALRVAGVDPGTALYRKGVKFLVNSQKKDGSWFVETRSRPIQTFFDNGDPGGKSQFISFAATSWAVLALLETFPETKLATSMR